MNNKFVLNNRRNQKKNSLSKFIVDRLFSEYIIQIEIKFQKT